MPVAGHDWVLLQTPRANEHARHAGNVAEALEGGRGFGSALQVVLRYLGGAASMPQLATERAASDNGASSGGRANGLQGLSGMTYAGAARDSAAGITP